MKIEVGYGTDIIGQTAVKYQIIAPLKYGGYVVREAPFEMTRPDGTTYHAHSITGLIIKDKLFNIHTEEIENGEDNNR